MHLRVTGLCALCKRDLESPSDLCQQLISGCRDRAYSCDRGVTNPSGALHDKKCRPGYGVKLMRGGFVSLHGIESQVAAAVRVVVDKPLIRVLHLQINLHDTRCCFGTDPAIFEDIGPLISEVKCLDMQHLFGLAQREFRLNGWRRFLNALMQELIAVDTTALLNFIACYRNVERGAGYGVTTNLCAAFALALDDSCV